MFHKTWKPIPRQDVSSLIQQFEERIAASPPRTSPDKAFSSSRRHSYVLDDVPEDPSDTEDYMIPRETPVSSPTSPVHRTGTLSNRRSLPRMPHVHPTTIIPDEDIPMPNVWPTAYGEVSPRTDNAWPTLAEADAEDKRTKKLKLQRRQSSRISKTRKFMDKGKQRMTTIKTFAAKHRIYSPRRTSTPRGSEETFALRTPKRVLESKPSFKSRAWRAARGAIHGLRHLPETSADAVGNAREATTQTAKTIRKTASETHLRMRSKIEKTKDVISSSVPVIRPPRSMYSPIAATSEHPLIEHTQTVLVLPPSTEPVELVEPWNGVIPPPPNSARSRPRNRLRKRQNNSFRRSFDNDELAKSKLPNTTPLNANFAQALVSDVHHQAEDAIVPMIIVTEDVDNHGSWYLPINNQGQFQVRYAFSRKSSSSDSPRSSLDSQGGFRLFFRRKKYYNGRLSFGSVTSSQEVELQRSDSRVQEQLLISYTDETPLLVEFFSRGARE